MTTSRTYTLPTSDPSLPLWNKVSSGERALIEEHLQGPPVSVGRIASALGIEVLSSSLQSDISGQIRKKSSDGVYEIKVNIADPAVRQRFTVAHEISHFLLHRNDIDGDGITDTVLYRSKLSDRKEAEANRLAAFLLLPWERVLTWALEVHGVNVGSELINEIASSWKVSSLTVGYRFGF